MTNREIDKEIAEKVMGWGWSKPDEQGAMYNHPNAIGFEPSTDIQDAFLVVEKIISREGWEYDIVGDKDSIEIRFQAGDLLGVASVKVENGDIQKATSMAICLAARKAIRNGK